MGTHHEIVPRLKEVKAYLEGKKYKKMREMYSHDFSKYEPYIVKHTKNAKFLFCQLTQTTLPMDPVKVQKHAESKRFKERVKETDEEAKRKEAKSAKKKLLRERLNKISLAKREANKNGEIPAKKPKAATAENAENPKKNLKRRLKMHKNLKRKKPDTSVQADAETPKTNEQDNEPEMIVKEGKKKIPLRAQKRLRKNQM